MARKRTYVSTAYGTPVRTTVTLPRKRERGGGRPPPRSRVPMTRTETGLEVPTITQGPVSPREREFEREVRREARTLKKALKLPPSKQVERYGFEGATFLRQVAQAEQARKRLERQRRQTIEAAEKAAREEERGRRERRKRWFGAGSAIEHYKALGGAVGALGGEAIPDIWENREQLGAAAIPFNPVVGEVLAKMALGIPAGVYGLRHPGAAKRDIANQASSLVQLPGLLLASVDPRTSKAARDRIVKQMYRENVRGFLDLYGPGTSWQTAFERQQKVPVSSIVTGVSFVGGPAARGASLIRGVRAGLTPGEAVDAIARPYLRGPEHERVLRLRGGPAGRGEDVVIEWARSPLWRPIQRGYDVVSRRISQTTPGVRVFSEEVRASKAKRREMQRSLDRDMAMADVAMREIGRLTGEEQQRLLRTRDKPSDIPDDVWLAGMIEEMKDMLEGREIIRAKKPSEAVARLNRRIAYLEKRRDAAIDRRVGRIVGEQLEPLVTRSKSLRGQIRERRRRGESTDVLEQQLYDVNARIELARGERVRPVRNSPEREQFARILAEQVGQEKVGPLLQASDALARAAEPDNPSKWYETRLAESSIGSAEEMARLAAQGEVLYQRPGYQGNLVRMNQGEPEPGDIVYLRGDESREPYVVVNRLTNPIDGVDDLVLNDADGRFAGRIALDEVGDVVNLPLGRRVVTRDGVAGQITGGNPSQNFLTIRGDDGSTYEMAIHNVAPEHTPIFYSHAQRVIEEKGQPKATAEQWVKLLEKEGVKADEMEWAGINDFLDLKKAAGMKSIPKDDLLQFLANPLNAFDLAEVFYSGRDSTYGFRPRWGPDRGEGLVIRDDPDGYFELVMTMPGETAYRSGHWSGVSNPILHIRFHEVTENDPTSISGTRRKLLIDELQSDWHQDIQKHGAKEKGWEEARDEINAEIQGVIAREDAIASKFGVTVEEMSALHRKLAADLIEEVKAEQHRIEALESRRLDPDEIEALYEKRRTPETQAVKRAFALIQRLKERRQRLGNEVRALERGIAPGPFGKNRWLDLAMKRMVAYAAKEGFDRIEWVDGHTHAVRYELFDHGLEAERYEYESPEDHPYYPNEEDYQHEYTYAKYEFNTLPDDSPFIQERLFGTNRPPSYDPHRPIREVTWNDPWKVTPEGVPMAETQPLRIEANEFEDFFTYGTSPGDYITPEDGPFQGVHMRVVGRDGDDLLAVPTGVARVEVSGTKDAGGGDQRIEVSLYDSTGHFIESEEIEVGPNYYLAEALDRMADERISTLSTQSWFDSLDGEYDRSWEYELDEGGWRDAVDYWQEEYGHEVGESSRDYSFDEIQHMDDYTSSGVGVVKFYDEILPSAVNKLFKKEEVRVEKSTVQGRYSSEQSGVLTEYGPIDTFGFDVTPDLKALALRGQRLFQASHHGNIKGATEFLGGNRTALRLFASADVSTVLHELGHIALLDMDDLDLEVLDRAFAGGRSYRRGEWTREDNERYARAWERYFLDGKAQTTALRGVFEKLMTWMKLVYTQAQALGARTSPEVDAVFAKRLGKIEMQEADIVRYAGRFDKEVVRWGTLIANAKTELQALEARIAAMREKRSDHVLEAEREALEETRAKTNDEDTFQELSEKIDAIEEELHERTLTRLTRSERREKLLTMQLEQLEQALASETSPGYDMAVAAADFLQGDRELILREVLGDAFDPIMEGRREQMSNWLVARGHLPETARGRGRGFFPFTREKGVKAVGRSATPQNRRFGKQSKAALNVHKRNEMLLWQLGDYRADARILLESWSKAQAFKWQHDLRQLLYNVGEDVGRGGPKKNWYLINPEGKPLPREWQSALSPEEIDRFFDDLEGDSDDGLATRIELFTKNWISKEPSDFVSPDGAYPGIRQVHPAVVHSLLLPYQSGMPVRSLMGLADVVNSIARLSLIYTNPGYIPSNVVANSILGMLNSPWFLKDMGTAATWLATERGMARLIEAEMGGGSLSAMLPERGFTKRVEEQVVGVVKIPADDWPRLAAWISTARRNGYRGKEDLWRLLQSKDPKVMRDRDFISREAQDAMLNFNRLGPMEKRYLQSVLFVWPFIRAATAWPFTYLRDFPERAGIAIAATQGYGEQAREELGPTPPYYGSMVPIVIDAKKAEASVANLQSVSPLGPLADIMKTAYAVGRSVVYGDPVPTFDSLFGYVAPQYQAAVYLLQGRTEFGQAEGLRGIAARDLGELVPGLGLLTDVLNENKPAIYMEQDLWNTLLRRTLRFSPQQVNLNVLNEQAETRKAKTPAQLTNALIKKTRAVWSQSYPTEPMPRSVENSIRSFYAHSEARRLKQEAIKESGEWEPKRGERTPKLTPLQEATLAYDILNAYYPGTAEEYELLDPEIVMKRDGELAVEEYGKRIRSFMFKLKDRAQEAIREAEKRKKLRKAAA